MSYLLTQMFLYMLATFILGLLLGWFLWKYNEAGADCDCDDMRAKLRALEAENAKLKAGNTASAAAASVAAPAIAADSPGTRPEALKAARGGQPDDLQQISGIGPKLEKLCHSLGFYHFDQIANWTADEVAWVDHNLEGFKGRVTRDEWIKQAKKLA